MTSEHSIWCERLVGGDWRPFTVCTLDECSAAVRYWTYLGERYSAAASAGTTALFCAGLDRALQRRTGDHERRRVASWYLEVAWRREGATPAQGF
jgi:hypothetical protein